MSNEEKTKSAEEVLAELTAADAKGLADHIAEVGGDVDAYLADTPLPLDLREEDAARFREMLGSRLKEVLLPSKVQELLETAKRIAAEQGSQTVRVENVSHLLAGGRTRETVFHLPPAMVRCVPGRFVPVTVATILEHREWYRKLVVGGFLRVHCPTEDLFEGIVPVFVDAPFVPVLSLHPMDSAADDNNGMLQVIPKDPTQPDPPENFQMPVTPSAMGTEEEPPAEDEAPVEDPYNAPLPDTRPEGEGPPAEDESEDEDESEGPGEATGPAGPEAPAGGEPKAGKKKKGKK